MPLGMDVGTYNIICAQRNDNGNEIHYRKTVNAFVELDLNPHNQALIESSKGKIPVIERKNSGYILGKDALEMAIDSHLELKRPIHEGILNSNERNAYKILQIMCHNMIGKIQKDKDVLFYCTPSNRVDGKNATDLHNEVLSEIFKSYNSKGKTLSFHRINEGLALVYAELGDKQFTGIGLSFGAGLVNFCYSIYATEVITFSTTKAGDWIDQQVSEATGENVLIVNKIRENIDLQADYANSIEKAIKQYYQLMIEDTVISMKYLMTNANIESNKSIDIIVAGGTASPNGFIELLKNAIIKARLPIQIGEIRKSEDHLYSVCRGCLIAAETF